MEYRLLQVDDYYRGFLQVLEQLTIVNSDSISYEDFKKQFNKHNSDIYVIHDTHNNKIVGTGSIYMEHKFIHKLGTVGHIEDVVIDKEYRNMKLGKQLIDKLVNIGKTNGCYKIVLYCDFETTSFYEYNGFTNKGNYVALYV
jgi:glucosamine-phosphate N-acetyltransferase